jgi:hypothetical protein
MTATDCADLRLRVLLRAYGTLRQLEHERSKRFVIHLDQREPASTNLGTYVGDLDDKGRKDGHAHFGADAVLRRVVYRDHVQVVALAGPPTLCRRRSAETTAGCAPGAVFDEEGGRGQKRGEMNPSAPACVAAFGGSLCVRNYRPRLVPDAAWPRTRIADCNPFAVH